MTRANGTIGIALVLILGGIGCSDSTTSTDDDDFLPVFSNIWHNVTDANHIFNLASADDGKPSGNFTGTEEHPSLGESEISGTFTNSTCQMVIARPGGNVTYSGKFVHADTLRLTRSGETLVIARNE